MLNLAELYFSGKARLGGLEMDRAKARELFERAGQADTGPISACARTRLAKCLSDGVGGPPDKERARRILQEVADTVIEKPDPNGVGLARHNLARSFEREGNMEKAYEYFRGSAEAGSLMGAIAYAELARNRRTGDAIEHAKRLLANAMQNRRSPITGQEAQRLEQARARLGM
jgi:TPR repeat protein